MTNNAIIGPYELEPTFFDCSTVYRPADRIGDMKELQRAWLEEKLVKEGCSDIEIALILSEIE